MIDWEARFSEPGYAYGTEPNAFLVSVESKIPQGPVLSLADGEGRNSVFLAERGHEVVAVDRSAAGLSKGRQLAETRGVSIQTVLADLGEYVIAPGAWSGIIAIFAHMLPPVRARMHRGVVAGLRSGGVYVLEAYTPRQLAFATGGPREIDLLMELPQLRTELEGLELEVAREIERDVIEGTYHRGRSAVVQILGWKPQA